jgi:hypothetical protein
MVLPQKVEVNILLPDCKQREQSTTDFAVVEYVVLVVLMGAVVEYVVLVVLMGAVVEYVVLVVLMGVPMIGTDINTGIKRSPKRTSCFDLTTPRFYFYGIYL